MNPRSFDALARALAGRLPRRGVVGRLGGLLLGAGVAATPGSTGAQEGGAEGTVLLPCEPCNCTGDACECCLPGITGGGVVQTERGNVNFVLFATRLAGEGSEAAAGFVRWVDPHLEGGLSLESVGPVAYQEDPEEERARQVRGVMKVNGGEEQPFVLRAYDSGLAEPGQDSARITVGDPSGGFGYAAEGPLVGGDLQLLSTVAPISRP